MTLSFARNKARSGRTVAWWKFTKGETWFGAVYRNTIQNSRDDSLVKCLLQQKRAPSFSLDKLLTAWHYNSVCTKDKTTLSLLAERKTQMKSVYSLSSTKLIPTYFGMRSNPGVKRLTEFKCFQLAQLNFGTLTLRCNDDIPFLTVSFWILLKREGVGWTHKHWVSTRCG